MIRSETNEKLDFEGHYPQNTILHCIISNETQIKLNFFHGSFSAMPELRADLFLAISKTGMCLLTSSFFKPFTILVPSWSRFETSFSTFLKLVKISYDSVYTSYQNTSCIILKQPCIRC